MHEADDSCENQKTWVISVSVGIERIISKFVTIWFVMDSSLLLEVMTTWIGREDVLVMVKWQVLQMSVRVVNVHCGHRGSLHASEGYHLLVDRSNEFVISICLHNSSSKASDLLAHHAESRR